jgi:hypothetical protein
MNASNDVLQERFSAIASDKDDSDWAEVVDRAGPAQRLPGGRGRQARILLAAGIAAFGLGVGVTIVSGSTLDQSPTIPGQPGPTRVDRQPSKGTIRWLFRHEQRGQSLWAAGIPVGSTVGSHWQPVRFARVLQPNPRSSARIVVSLIGRRGRNICMTVVLPRTGFGGCAIGMDLRPFSVSTAFGLNITGGDGVVLAGLASDEVARMELFIAGGARRHVPLRDNAFFIRVTSKELPCNLVAYDTHGDVIGTGARSNVLPSLHS